MNLRLRETHRFLRAGLGQPEVSGAVRRRVVVHVVQRFRVAAPDPKTLPDLHADHVRHVTAILLIQQGRFILRPVARGRVREVHEHVRERAGLFVHHDSLVEQRVDCSFMTRLVADLVPLGAVPMNVTLPRIVPDPKVG
jgi:hypothetical protein